MKVYRLNVKNSITVMHFSAQFKKTCDSIGVSEGKALWTMPTFMKGKTAYSSTVLMNPYKDDETVHRLAMADNEQPCTYMEADDFLLKSYATDSNIAKKIWRLLP